MPNENVIRQDVIEVSIKSNSSGLDKLNNDFNDLKKSVSGDLDKGLKKTKSSVDNLGKSNGIDKLAKDTNKASKAFKDTKKSINDSEKGAKTFKSILSNVGKTSVSKVSSGFEKIKASIEKAKTHTQNFTSRLKDAEKVNLNKLNNGLSNVSKKLKDISKKAAGAAFNGLKRLAGISFKAIGAGIGAAATAVGMLVKQSVAAYGEQQQLVGGVETLFGAGGAKDVKEYAKNVGKSVSQVTDKYKTLKDVEKTVIRNANDAYKTSGLSANDYMNTVTSFSSSLIQSLKGDTKKAASVANRAIIDMSDNANKMGTDMGLIKNAYQGFAKQNYTIKSNSRAA